VDIKAAKDHRKSVQSASKKESSVLVEQLGKGGQGSTALVKHKTSGKEYAAKLITCPNLEDAMYANDEAKIMGTMKGPQFVKLVESFVVPATLGTDELFIIMEYCARGDLERCISEADGGRLSE
jgi:serine/threonine protein kinase